LENCGQIAEAITDVIVVITKLMERKMKYSGTSKNFTPHTQTPNALAC